VEDADATDGAGPGHEAGLSLADIYDRGDSLATRVIANETLVVPFKGTLASLHQIFALNPVAAFAWQRFDGKATLDSILADVLESFEVSRERAGADLLELIRGLRDAGLVRKVTREPGGSSGA
jgi:hypothetical protein